MSLAKRKAAAARYKPKAVKLLLVAEAPPCDTDRYFYFENVAEHDWLFRYVWEGLTGEKPDRAEKAAHLASLCKAGVFLIDLHEENVSQPTLAALTPHVQGLVARCRALRPAHIIVIKHSVHDAAHAALHAAGLPVIDQRIPFPASGQQKKFLQTFGAAVQSAGFAMPASALA